MDMSGPAREELSSLLHSLCEKLGQHDHRDDSEMLERETERHVKTIRSSLGRVLKSGKNDVFVRYLMEQLESLAAISADASSKAVLRVTEHQFRNAHLLIDAFGETERVLRYTWQIKPLERLFDDEPWREHFELTSSMAIAGELGVRTIAIVEDQTQCNAANVQKLLEFFASHENLNVKIVRRADWEVCMTDYAIPEECIEFGIYGQNLLYEARTYTPVSIGSWSKDPVEIRRFTRFFDAIWNDQKVAGNNPASKEQKVSLSRLMAVDSAQTRRANAVHDSLDRLEERINSDAA